MTDMLNQRMFRRALVVIAVAGLVLGFLAQLLATERGRDGYGRREPPRS